MDIVEMMAEKAVHNVERLYGMDTYGYINIPLLDVEELNDNYSEDTVQDICEQAVELLSEWLSINGLSGIPDFDEESVFIS